IEPARSAGCIGIDFVEMSYGVEGTRGNWERQGVLEAASRYQSGASTHAARLSTARRPSAVRTCRYGSDASGLLCPLTPEKAAQGMPACSERVTYECLNQCVVAVGWSTPAASRAVRRSSLSSVLVFGDPLGRCHT